MTYTATDNVRSLLLEARTQLPYGSCKRPCVAPPVAFASVLFGQLLKGRPGCICRKTKEKSSETRDK
jgi:hypothetical protein